MFRTELIHGVTKERRPVTFFEDDTIEVVRQQASKAFDIHPDRMFLLVGIQFPRSYYTRDKRNWDALFMRLSLNGMPIPREMFAAYCSEYRSPAIAIPYRELIDRETWMEYPDDLRDIFEPPGDFIEYRILGVDQFKSYALPWKPSAGLSARIPAAQQPIPENARIFTSFYPMSSIRSMVMIPYTAEDEGTTAYFPLLRATTPARLSVDTIRTMDETSVHLVDVLNLDPPVPAEVNVLRAKWYVPFVDTNFGDAVRIRFEQIFYGLTLSEKSPCVTYFTSNADSSRHKFFVEDTKNKTPVLDLAMWISWWTNSKPSRNRPTLVLYRGKSREHYDRISISSIDITFSAYRDTSNTESVEELRKSLEEWYETLDAVTPFVETSDMVPCRWELQDIKFSARYAKEMHELDPRRLNCIQFLFSTMDLNKSTFRLLRADASGEDVSPSELRILQRMRETPGLTPADIDFLPIQEATRTLAGLQLRLEEDPGLIQRVFTSFPIVQFSQDRAVMSSARSMDLPLRYINILRYILSDPKSKELDRVCPKRMETVGAEKVVVPTTVVDVDLAAEFGDLFEYLEEDKEEQKEEEPVEEKKIKIKQKSDTQHKYFYKRLQALDPGRFNEDESKRYTKECEQSHQPIALTEEELTRIMKEYDPRENLPPEKRMNIASGLVVCPEYWCMYDKIPLQESQLVMREGSLACPVCLGKLRTSAKMKDPREYPLIERPKSFNYPKTKYTTDEGEDMPCCYKTPGKKKIVDEERENKYYIQLETKMGLGPFRIAYLPTTVLNALKIPEEYTLERNAQNRIQSGVSGFFRVGIGLPRETIGTFVGLATAVPQPKDNIKIIMKCSFLNTWRETDDRDFAEIREKVELQDDLSRDHVTRLICGIQRAYEEKRLSKLQELEYVSLSLQTDIFHLHLDTNTASCLFFSQARPRTRSIVILERGEDIDILAHVTRIGKRFEFNANVYTPPFTKEQTLELERLRYFACMTDVPRLEDASRLLRDLIAEYGDTLMFIQDPFGRIQAFFFPNHISLPFKNVTFGETSYPKVAGYHLVVDQLPTYENAMEALNRMKSPYYMYESDVYDGDGNVVELMLKNGLRIPIRPTKKKPAGDIENEMTNILRQPESVLAFGEKNKEDHTTYSTISYASEVYDYLLFELSNTLEHATPLRRAIAAVDEELLDPLLREWFDRAILVVDTPVQFISKIRTPCGQFTKQDTCEKGTMCGWNGSQCRLKVRDTLSLPMLYRKLKHALLENSKTRSLVLDGRITPFFSTILYLELPNEVILTDFDIRQK